MTADETSFRRFAAPGVWCGLGILGTLGASVLGTVAGINYTRPGPVLALWLLAWAAAIALASLGAWRLLRLRAHAWLIPIAALSLVVLRPGRVDAATWRLEWGIFGLAWTLVAAVSFARAFLGSDELERRTYVDGAALGLVILAPLAAAYALFETQLPPLTAQTVAATLLLAWWGGWLVAAVRYR